MKMTMSRRVAMAAIVAGMAIPLMLPSQISARVLSGSVTERKINRKINSLLKSARKSHDSGKIQQALDTYWKILELDPNETFAYLELGEIYVKLKIFDRAVELLEPGLKLASREMDNETVCYYFCIMTEAYLGLNKTGEANKSLIKAAKTSPKSPMPRKILGDIYLANNRIADAFKAYKKAIELDPDYVPAKEKLGELTAAYGDQSHVKTKNKKAIAEKAVKLPASGTSKASQTTTSVASNTTENNPLTDSAKADQTIIAMPAPAVSEPASEPAAINKTVANIAEPEPTPTTTDNSEEKKEVSPVLDRPRPVPAPVVPTVILVKEPPTASTATAAVDPVDADSAMIDEQIDKLLAGSPEDKKGAAAYLVKLEEKGLNHVEELLYDSDPEVRIIAIRVLPEFKAYTDRVKTMLDDASEDPDPSVVEEIKKALGSL